jgi:RNA polymerase sigma factor (sigma-70 family)
MQTNYNQEEIDSYAIELLVLRERANSGDLKIKLQYKKYQDFCMEKFKYLIDFRTSKYKTFSNYEDLQQDGFEALVCALNTYKASKGSFSWWCDQYIKTRISRAANKHSTIKYPIDKVSSKLKPHKVSKIPAVEDPAPSVCKKMQDVEEANVLKQAVKELPKESIELLNLIYGFGDITLHSIGEAAEELNYSKKECRNLLRRTKNKLKNKLGKME